MSAKPPEVVEVRITWAPSDFRIEIYGPGAPPPVTARTYVDSLKAVNEVLAPLLETMRGKQK